MPKSVLGEVPRDTIPKLYNDVLSCTERLPANLLSNLTSIYIELRRGRGVFVQQNNFISLKFSDSNGEYIRSYPMGVLRVVASLNTTLTEEQKDVLNTVVLSHFTTAQFHFYVDPKRSGKTNIAITVSAYNDE